MRRRDFITLFVGGIASSASWPLAVRAQQDRVRRVGVLAGGRADGPYAQTFSAAFGDGLVALGWQEGRNLQIEWRWAGSDAELYQRYAGELTALGPDVVVAVGSSSVQALRRHGSAIPIVFVMITDPVGQGFVASLAHPGGNVTGFSNYEPAMGGKWLGMLAQITPPVAHAAVLYNPSAAPFASLVLPAIQESASLVGIAVRPTPVHDDVEIEAVMGELARARGSGVIVMSDIFTLGHREIIIAAAARHRLPAVYPDRRYIAAGGLMSYGVDPTDLYRRSADYVIRILNGAKPADLPVQTPTKFELVINLKTAKALGITIPQTLLATADEVIE